MTRTLDDERELDEGRRFIRLLRYKSYPCLAELAKRAPEPGEFVIRKPPGLGYTRYVSEIFESIMPEGFGDPDAMGFEDLDLGFSETADLAEALRFTHAEAIRLTIRIMEVLGYDIPGDHGDYYEPMRLDVAQELHNRARQRPRVSRDLHAMIRNLDREP